MKKSLIILLSVLWLGAAAQPKSVLDIKDNNDFSSFEILTPSSLKKYRLFFTGEDHRFRQSNSMLELKLFRYLHENAGVDVLLLEFGEGLGYIVNQYVQTGDSASQIILEKFLFEEYYEQVEGLRKYYTELKSDKKFRVMGIDIERSPLFAVKKLEMLLPDRRMAHDSILVSVDAIRALSEFYDNKRQTDGFFTDDDDDLLSYNDSGYLPNKTRINAWRSLKLVLENFEKHKQEYRHFLGENFWVFEETMTHIAEYYYWDNLEGTAQIWLYRESQMEKTLNNLFATDDDIKAYGQFGRCHTQRRREKAECPYYFFNSLATRINTGINPKLAGKVFSCAIFYPQTFDFRDDVRPSINTGVEALAKKSDKNELTLYLLDSTAKVDESLKQRFNAIIVNNLKNDRVRSFGSDADDSYEYHGPRVSFLAEGGFSGYNFTNLNKTLGTNFDQEPQFFGVSITMAENRNFNFKTSFHAYTQADRKLSDTSDVSLRGYRFLQQYGGDIIKNKHIDLTPFFGLGYEWWILDSREEYTDPTRKDVMGNNRHTRYKNPGFIVSAGLDFRVYIDWVTLGFFAHYQGDLSKQSWRRNGSVVGGTPRFSLSSYTVGASIGFNFLAD